MRAGRSLGPLAALAVAAMLLGPGCSGFRPVPLPRADAPDPPSLIGKQIRVQLTDERELTFIVARESADSLWASQSLTTPPGPAVATAEIVSMEVEAFDWGNTGKVAGAGVLAVLALAKIFEDLSFD